MPMVGLGACPWSEARAARNRGGSGRGGWVAFPARAGGTPETGPRCVLPVIPVIPYVLSIEHVIHPLRLGT